MFLQTQSKAALAADCLLSTAFLFFLVTIQTTLVHEIRIFGAVPSLPLAYCITKSVRQGGCLPIVLSTLGGVMLDTASGRAIGAAGLIFLYLSAGCVFFRQHLFCKRLLATLLCVAVCSLLYETLLFFAGAPAENILKDTAYSLAVTPIYYLIGKKCRF